MSLNRVDNGRADSASLPKVLSGRRVLMVLGCLDLGGSERQALHAAGVLRRLGAEVQVWAFRPTGRAATLCEQMGIPWRYVPEPWGWGPLRWPLMIARLAQTFRRALPDLLLPYTAFPNVVCGLVWRFTGARTCIWNQRDTGMGLDSPTVPWAVRNTPLFLSNSQVGKDFLVERLGVAPRRIRVVPNAVALHRPQADRATWRARLGADASCLVACMVANIHRNKDHATLVRAWKTVVETLNAQRRSAVLALAGRPDETEDLLRLIHAWRLTDAIRILGEVEDVAGLLSAVDLAVFSSRSEGCPNAVLESMAAGLAVVATDCPGVREAVGETGLAWLAPPGDPEAFAHLMLQLADHPELRAELGLNNRRRVEKEFTLERLEARLATLVPTALESRRWPEDVESSAAEASAGPARDRARS